MSADGPYHLGKYVKRVIASNSTVCILGTSHIGRYSGRDERVSTTMAKNTVVLLLMLVCFNISSLYC